MPTSRIRLTCRSSAPFCSCITHQESLFLFQLFSTADTDSSKTTKGAPSLVILILAVIVDPTELLLDPDIKDMRTRSTPDHHSAVWSLPLHPIQLHIELQIGFFDGRRPKWPPSAERVDDRRGSIRSVAYSWTLAPYKLSDTHAILNNRIFYQHSISMHRRRNRD
jgi:hypothetical protein